jgi:hypothetical protein
VGVYFDFMCKELLAVPILNALFADNLVKQQICVYILLFTILRPISAQSGINKYYDNGFRAAYFGAIEASNDTIVTYGPVLSQVGKSGFALTFLDTFGQVLSVKEFFHPNGLNLTQVYPRGLIKPKRHAGYAVVGQVFENGNGFFALANEQGVVVLYKEYPDFQSLVDFYQQVIEIDDGYLIFGRKAPQFLGDIFVKKIDFNGIQIWEKRFGSATRSSYFGSAVILHSNEYLIGGSNTNNVSGVPYQQVNYTSRAIAIDSLGNKKWEWSGQPGLGEFGVGSLFKNHQGNWTYFTGQGWYNAAADAIVSTPKMVVRDTLFNLIWSDTLGSFHPDHSNFINHTIQLRDSGFLAMGVKSEFGISPNGPPGWLVRLDKDLNQVWSRADTTPLSFPAFFRCDFYDAVELPSGSIVACGSVNTYTPDRKEWAWLFKVSADGCIETLDCFTSGVEEIDEERLVTLSPNPTNGLIYLQYQLRTSAMSRGVIRFFNPSGVLVFSQLIDASTDQKDISIAHLPNGLYFWHLTDGVGVVASGKVVKVE